MRDNNPRQTDSSKPTSIIVTGQTDSSKQTNSSKQTSMVVSGKTGSSDDYGRSTSELKKSIKSPKSQGFPLRPRAPLSHPPSRALLPALAPGQTTREALAPGRSSALSLPLGDGSSVAAGADSPSAVGSD